MQEKIISAWSILSRNATDEFDLENFTCMQCDLASFASVRKFVEDIEDFRAEKPIDRFVCNAAVYQPTLAEAKWSEDNIEQQMQINFLSHFLMASKMVKESQFSVRMRSDSNF